MEWIMELLTEVEEEASRRNWEVCLKVIETLELPKKKTKPGRSRRHRKRLLADHPYCYYCGVGLDLDTSTVDHVLPLSKGGNWSRDNLVLACENCNRKKGCEYPIPN